MAWTFACRREYFRLPRAQRRWQDDNDQSPDADSGTAHVFGIQVAEADRSIEVRRRIGFVTEDKNSTLT